MKQSFILYTEYNDIFQSLSDEEAGQLIKAIINYQSTGMLPAFSSGEVSMAFKFIKMDMDRNSQKYAETVEKRRIAGRKGGLTASRNNIAKHSKTQQDIHDNDNVNDNDNDNVNDNVSQQMCDMAADAASVLIKTLNERTGTTYKPDAVRTVQLVRNLINAGYTLEQMQSVVERKCDDWLGTKFETALKPSTLFDPGKFDEYLNQPDSDAVKRKQNKEKRTRLLHDYRGEFDAVCTQLEAEQDKKVQKDLKFRREWLSEQIERLEAVEA